MAASSNRSADAGKPPAPNGAPARWPPSLPPAVSAALWRGSELGSSAAPVLGSGFAALDAELPGGGWPCRSVTEVLQTQPTVAEWRLLAPAMREIVSAGRAVVLVGPPKTPHLPGLRHLGLDERQLVWIRAETPAERLWATEQLVRAGAAGLLVAWLPQARPEQLRRLQIAAQSCAGPAFLCRPAAAALEASAAPLRVQLRFGVDWELLVHLCKRRGALHEGELRLASVPGGLERLLTPRLRRPDRLIDVRRERDGSEVSDAVGCPASRPSVARSAATH